MPLKFVGRSWSETVPICERAITVWGSGELYVKAVSEKKISKPDNIQCFDGFWDGSCSPSPLSLSLSLSSLHQPPPDKGHIVREYHWATEY